MLLGIALYRNISILVLVMLCDFHVSARRYNSKQRHRQSVAMASAHTRERKKAVESSIATSGARQVVRNMEALLYVYVIGTHRKRDDHDWSPRAKTSQQLSQKGRCLGIAVAIAWALTTSLMTLGTG